MSIEFPGEASFNWKKFLEAVLKEDLSDGVDITSEFLIPPEHRSRMALYVKQNGILAGVNAAKRMFSTYLPEKIHFEKILSDGAFVQKGDVAFYVEGPSRDLLLMERAVLNIMQRMSGIATKTRAFQEMCKGTKAKVTDTRKTTPLFRFFEKWAVWIGGGTNHRMGLFDMILIKDNHIDICGGMANVLKKAEHFFKNKKIHMIVVEARTLSDVEILAEHPLVDRILLDNFPVEQTAKAVNINAGRKLLESSGGIHEENIREYALCGVDFISVGELTHTIQSMDLSLKTVKIKN